MAPERYRYSKDDKGKTVLFIGILLVLIVVIGGGLLLLISQKGPVVVPPSNVTNQTPPPTNNTPTNVTPVCDDSCHLSRAQSQANYSQCLLISTDSLKQDCYVSLSNVSLEACQAIGDAGRKAVCITAFAVAGANITLCDSLTVGKAACQYAVNPCVNATDMPLCSAMRDRNPAECQSDADCLLNYSTAMKDQASCSLIADQVLSKACSSSVSFSDKCVDLPAPYQRDACYSLYARYTNDYLECSQITPETNASLSCFEYFAAKNRDKSICNYFMLDDKWACLIYYSLNTQDISGCEGIDPLATSNTFQCAYQYAIKYGDPSACQVISQSLSVTSTCYQGAIIYYNQNLDFHNCANVTNFVWGNKCYTEAAKIDNNVTICNLITTDYAKQSCQDAYAANKSQ